MPASLTWARRALWTQIGLLLLAVVVTVAAPSVAAEMSGGQQYGAAGLMVATPLYVLAPLMIGAAGAGLVAVRRPAWRLRVAIALLAPLLFVIGSGVEWLLDAEPETDTDADLVADTSGLPASVQSSLEAADRSVALTLQVLEWAHWLMFLAICCGVTSGILLLRALRQDERR